MIRASGELGPNRNGRFEPVHLRHLQVHQRHVGPMGAELLDGLAAARAFGDELHVRLAGEQRRHAVAEQRVIVDGQDANGRGITHATADFA